MNIITPKPSNQTNVDFIREFEKVEKNISREENSVKVDVNQRYKKLKDKKAKKEQY